MVVSFGYFEYVLCFIWINKISLFIIDHIKRKVRRRPSWGRGIIRKKKNYKKGLEEEEEDEPEAEVEAAGPSDSCLTLDEESSCDITGPQPNGHHPHALSTEEESSNEPPVAAPAEPPEANDATDEPTYKGEESKAKRGESEKKVELHFLGRSSHPNVDGDSKTSQVDFQPLTETSESSDAEAQPKHAEDLLVSQVDCVNGNESMESLDLQSPEMSSEAENRTPQSTVEGSNTPEREEHKNKHENHPTQDQPPQDGTAVTEGAEEDLDKEGIKLDRTYCSPCLSSMFLCLNTDVFNLFTYYRIFLAVDACFTSCTVLMSVSVGPQVKKLSLSITFSNVWTSHQSARLISFQ